VSDIKQYELTAIKLEKCSIASVTTIILVSLTADASPLAKCNTYLAPVREQSVDCVLSSYRIPDAKMSVLLLLFDIILILFFSVH